MNDWIFVSEATVVLQVSAPLKRTAFTLVLNILILVDLERSLAFHIYLFQHIEGCSGFPDPHFDVFVGAS